MRNFYTRSSYIIWVLMLAGILGIPGFVYGQCTPVPPPSRPCGGGDGQVVDGQVIGKSQEYWFDGSETYFSKGLILNGGTLRICGHLKLETLEIKGGTIVVESGGVLEVLANSNLTVSKRARIFNYGIISLQSDIQVLGNDNAIVNASTAAILDNGGYYFLLNGPSSWLVNFGGYMRFGTLDLRAPRGGVCLGNRGIIETDYLLNNQSNDILANGPKDGGCIQYNIEADLNNPGSESPDIYACELDGAVLRGPGGWNKATYVSPCQGCLKVLNFPFTYFEAHVGDDGVVNSWITQPGSDILEFQVYHSFDGVGFLPRSEVIPALESEEAEHYYWVDTQPDPAVNYYRLAMREVNGEVIYSDIRKVEMGLDIPPIRLFPNPAKDFMFVEYESGEALRGTFEILSLDGRSLQKGQLEYAAGREFLVLDLRGVSPGVYLLTFRDTDGFSFHWKILTY